MRGKFISENRNPLNRFFISAYQFILNKALRFKWVTLSIAIIALMSVAIPARYLSTEFMPSLYEGELLYMPVTLPSVSASKMREVLGQTNSLIMTIPEVERAFGKAGRADTATDAAPLSMIETWIKLKPKSEWEANVTLDDITERLNSALTLPGLVNSWGYPIETVSYTHLTLPTIYSV